MRRKGHPSRPRAITCCRFSSLKTLLMPTKATVPTSESTSQAPFSLAGFQVTIIGRFWVTAEVDTRAFLGTNQKEGPVSPSSGNNCLFYDWACRRTEGSNPDERVVFYQSFYRTRGTPESPGAFTGAILVYSQDVNCVWLERTKTVVPATAWDV